MQNEEKKKKKYVNADGKFFPEEPGLMDYVKEGFEPAQTRVQLDAIRKRRARAGNT